MPEIGLNGLLLDRPHSGTAVYTRHLAPLLPQVAPDLRFRLFVRHPDSVPACPPHERLSVPLEPLSSRVHAAAQIEKLLWEEIALPAAAAARRQVLIHSLYFAAPAVATCPVVVTIHDLIPLVVPRYHRSRQSALYSALMGRLVKRAAAIITVSQYSKRDIEAVLGIRGERIYVTPEAADERFRPQGEVGERERLAQKYGLPERFVLYLGGAERRKGIETLVGAWSRVARQMRDRDVKLVIVADFPPPDRLYPDVPGLIERLGLSRDIVAVSRVDEADKPALYRAALALAFPSRYEGFGLPPLEAMASGLPVVTSDATSLPEVVGNGGLLLPPEDLEAWASTLLRLVDSERERLALSEAGLRRAGAFSWRETAAATARVYREVLGR